MYCSCLCITPCAQSGCVFFLSVRMCLFSSLCSNLSAIIAGGRWSLFSPNSDCLHLYLIEQCLSEWKYNLHVTQILMWHCQATVIRKHSNVYWSWQPTDWLTNDHRMDTKLADKNLHETSGQLMAVIDLSYFLTEGGEHGCYWSVWDIKPIKWLVLFKWETCSCWALDGEPCSFHRKFSIVSLSSFAESRDCLICDTLGNWGHALSRVCWRLHSDSQDVECDQWTVGEGFICFLNMAADVVLSYFATVTTVSAFYHEYLSADHLMHILVEGEIATTFL